MGIKLQDPAFQETPEERELRKRAATRKRILVIFSTLIVTILCRFIIKDPSPPRVPDYSKDEIRYLPGMLDALPASERARLDPKIFAKMVEIDEKARRGELDQPQTLLAEGPYIPQEPLPEIDAEADKYKEQMYVYAAKKRRALIREKKKEQIDIRKIMLVQFRRGGHIKAEKTSYINGMYEIRLDRATLARLPSNLVSSITPNALTWEEPVPKGYVRLKPAKGITIIVEADTAKQITVRKNPFDET